MVYVRLADRSTRGVPAWMFDPAVCSGVKRLERGTFAWPKGTDVQDGKLRLNSTALAMLLDGIDMRHGCKRPWYELP